VLLYPPCTCKYVPIVACLATPKPPADCNAPLEIPDESVLLVAKIFAEYELFQGLATEPKLYVVPLNGIIPPLLTHASVPLNNNCAYVPVVGPTARPELIARPAVVVAVARYKILSPV